MTTVPTIFISIANATVTAIGTTYQTLIGTHGYIAIITLMILESASLPIPSEIVLPLTGYYVHSGVLNLYLAVLASLIGTIVGISIDYFVAYYFGKDVVYKHADRFHIKKERIVHFDEWFNRNAGITVFIGRLIPVVRGLISFPAGFAQMNLKEFYIYSMTGALIWNFALIAFGYYALSTNDLTITFSAIAIFVLILYAIYHVYKQKLSKKTIEVRI